MTYTRYRLNMTEPEARALIERAGLTPLTVVCLHVEVIATIERPLPKRGTKPLANEASAVQERLMDVNAMMTLYSVPDRRVHFRVVSNA